VPEPPKKPSPVAQALQEAASLLVPKAVSTNEPPGPTKPSGSGGLWYNRDLRQDLAGVIEQHARDSEK